MAFNRWLDLDKQQEDSVGQFVHFLGEWFAEVMCERIVQRYRNRVIFASELKSR